MIFRNKRECGGWILVDYTATWPYGYDFILDAAQVLIDFDLKDVLQYFATSEIAGGQYTDYTEEIKKQNYILRNCDFLSNEVGCLTLAGISKIMNCPIQIMFYNQSNKVTLRSPSKEYFETHGEHVFDNYMNTIEINAYCADTKRRTIESYKKHNPNEQ